MWGCAQAAGSGAEGGTADPLHAVSRLAGLQAESQNESSALGPAHSGAPRLAPMPLPFSRARLHPACAGLESGARHQMHASWCGTAARHRRRVPQSHRHELACNAKGDMAARGHPPCAGQHDAPTLATRMRSARRLARGSGAQGGAEWAASHPGAAVAAVGAKVAVHLVHRLGGVLLATPERAVRQRGPSLVAYAIAGEPRARVLAQPLDQARPLAAPDQRRPGAAAAAALQSGAGRGAGASGRGGRRWVLAQRQHLGVIQVASSASWGMPRWHQMAPEMGSWVTQQGTLGPKGLATTQAACHEGNRSLPCRRGAAAARMWCPPRSLPPGTPAQ